MEIIEKEKLNDNLTKFVIKSTHIANKALPGQFIVLMVTESGERIPLTIADSNSHRGTITIIFQEVGLTTKLLASLSCGDSLYSLVGPLGKPAEIKNYGKVIVLGGGVGIAEILPVIRALKEKGCEIISILGGRSADLVILQDQIKEFSDKLIITTNDGSLGEKGLATDPLKRLISGDDNYGLVFCVGPVPMMKAVAEATREAKIKTTVCLNALMIDGTGMCGCCRITVGNETKFTCVDGPDFDAHQVDFEQLMVRQNRFIEQEKHSMCKLDDKVREIRSEKGL